MNGRELNAIELFAGVGGFRLGLERSQHKVIWANEWDASACDVYDYNFGGQICRGDIRTIREESIPQHDLIAAGFPCQAFSFAGKRQGFADTRGTLFFEIVRIAKYHRTPYLLLENVKGLLNHKGGRTFAAILRTLDGLGYDIQWQVLNSKAFGVAQSRERVVIVANLRDVPQPAVFPLTPSHQRTQNGLHATKLCCAGTLAGVKRSQSSKVYCRLGLSPTLDTSGSPKLCAKDGARHLTPLECERLQAFPDNWTRYGRKPDGTEYEVSDTQRYKMMGNAVTTNVVEAVARRLP
jgi:DNA (cytosine-5)-methyltransferase 1